MPHIVFDNRINLNDFSKRFIPVFKKEHILIKIQTIFVDKDGLTALLPTVVISDIHQQFLIEISTRKEKTTIRLYPTTDPEKTDGVKLSMAMLAEHIMQIYPHFKITKTNLSVYLGMIVSS